MLIGNGLAQAPDVVIRSSAREVLLDVVVRDAHGKLVTNLKPGDVTVFEDGVRQDVRSFRLVAGGEVRSEDERQAAEARAEAQSPSPGASAVATPARPPVNPLRTVNVVCLVLSDLTAETRAFAFDSARKFVEQELRPNTFIGVFSLDSTGMRPVYPFSNNRDRLLDAVRLASINQLPAINLGSAAMLNGLSTQFGVTGLGSRGNSGDALGSQHDMTLAAIAGLREIDSLKGMVKQLTPLPFQKTVLLMSNGLTRPPDQLEYWDSLIHAATDGGVTFYAVDVHAMDPFYDPTALSSQMLTYSAGLSAQQGSTSLQGYTSGGGPSGNHGRLSSGQIAQAQQGHGPGAMDSLAQRTMELSHEDDYVKFAVSSANQQAAMRELAERTGGFLIANTNNVDRLLAHVMEEVDTHYEISYPPRTERDDGHFRKIEVKLARPGLRVETRSGYFAVPDIPGHPLTPDEMAGLRALDTHPLPHDFNFLSRVYRFRDAGGRTQYSIAFEMPILHLTATPEEAAHTHRLHVSLLALVKNADGEIVDRVSKDVPSEVSDGRLAAVRAELMTYQHAVSLTPGVYTVETAVVDEEDTRASTGLLRIDSRPAAGVQMSDLSLVRKLENLAGASDAADPFEYSGKRVLPFVTAELPAGAPPFVYFKIYPAAGSAGKMALRVRLLKDGRPIGTIKPEVGAADASGAIPMLVQLTTEPGRYEIQATLDQGKESVERSMSYSLPGS
ncbi:MAG TPA: VWA domain-containing protein [Bryobacteraceae bacterium]|jgi:VWFA-related protein|nr:VWA domain-containing protein [Bryobacteraceae bacterium]